MPRIRKKTSKRGTTHQRAKIQQKATESRKKKRKASKNDPTWKSKHKKDLGIPNNFPFKDQILAEIQEERRKAAEEKQQRKEAKRAATSEKKTDNQSREDSPDEEPFDGISSLDHAGLATSSGTQRKQKQKSALTVAHEEDEEPPILLQHDYPHLLSVLNKADVVVQVLDARDPDSFRSVDLEHIVARRSGTRIMLVLNKIDTCPRESVAASIKNLRTLHRHPVFPFRSASLFLPSADQVMFKPKSDVRPRQDDALGRDAIVECLNVWESQKPGNDPLLVAVVGVVNSGKSALINSLLRKDVLPLYKLSSSSSSPGSTTTTLPQQVTLSEHIRIIDTPGFSWRIHAPAPDAVPLIRARDILLHNKGRIDRLKDPTPTIEYIVSRADTQDLMLLYNLPSFEKKNAEAFLACLARTRRLTIKRGALDLAGAARIVLRDWSMGKFLWYTTTTPTLIPTAPAPTSSPSEEWDWLYSSDDEILSQLPARKEMRKRGLGLVRFASDVVLAVDQRKLDLEAPWEAALGSDGDSDADAESDADEENESADDNDDEDDDEADNDDDEKADDDDDDDGRSEDGHDEQEDEDQSAREDENEDTDEELPPPVSETRKRKRVKADPPRLPPAKKVTFKRTGVDNHLPKKPTAILQTPSKRKQPAPVKNKKMAANIPIKSKAPLDTGKHATQDAYDFAQFFGGGRIP